CAIGGSRWMNNFRPRAEIDYRQGKDHDDLECAVPQHRLPPAEIGDDALEQRRPHCAREDTSAREQSQYRSAPSIEPAGDIDVHRRIDDAETDQTNKQPVPDP